MYDHPDYLTMGQIVNGNDDLTQNATEGEITAYIADTMGVTTASLAGAAQDEAFTVLNAAGKLGIDAVAITAWTVGFFFGLRMSRGITTDQIDKNDPFLGVDRDSVNWMAFGRTRFMLAAPLFTTGSTRGREGRGPVVSSGESFIAESAWLDGVMTGIHFDKARVDS